MNREQALKLQSYLDGELPPRDSDAVRDWVSGDAEAQRLLRELQWSRAALSENEPVLAVPESREFYWVKIERAIQQDSSGASRARGPGWSSLLAYWESLQPGLRRLLAPSAGLALALFMVVGVVRFYDVTGPEDAPRYLAQIENPSEEMGSFSFRSQSDNVFVVWLYDRSAHAGVSRELLNSMVIQ